MIQNNIKKINQIPLKNITQNFENPFKKIKLKSFDYNSNTKINISNYNKLKNKMKNCKQTNDKEELIMLFKTKNFRIKFMVKVNKPYAKQKQRRILAITK